MSKFVEKSFGGTKEILKFPDHYVALAVMVDPTSNGIIDKENGLKFLPKGTLVGGIDGDSVFEALDVPVVDQYPLPIQATGEVGDISSEKNNHLAFVAVAPDAEGEDGNDIKIKFVDPDANTQTLACSVSGKEITFTMGTDGNGAVTTTALDIKAKIIATSTAAALISASVEANKGATKGDGVIDYAEVTPDWIQLTGGADEGTPEGVLLNDVDLTYGAKECAMLVHGFVKIDALPYTDKDEVAAAAGTVLPMIKFIK